MADWKHIIRTQLAPLGLPPEREIEIAEELAQHLETVYEEALSEKATESEAEARALNMIADGRLLECELSRVERPLRRAHLPPAACPEFLDQRRGMQMKNSWMDLRHSARLLLKNPGFTLLAIVTLALGIGANTAIFSVTNALVLRPLDFQDLDRLVTVSGTMPQQSAELYWMAPADFADFRRQQTGFIDMAAYQPAISNLTGAGDPERLQNYQVSAGFFRLLGGEALLGRTFVAEEEQAGRERVAVLSHDLWARRFGADPKIVGATISLDGKTHQVIGVMPENFDFPKPVGLWTPLALGIEAWNERQNRSLAAVARLKAGVELEQAKAEIETMAGRLAGQYPQTNTGRGATVRLLRRSVGNEYTEVFMNLLSAAVGFVLLIACVNIANMQLARATSRTREMAVRAALGARRLALARQMLSESLLLGLLGGACGLLVSYWFLDFIRDSIPLDRVRYVSGWKNLHLNERVMIFNLVISLVSCVVFGLVPALQTSKPNLNEALKEGGRSQGASAGRQRLRKALIVAEVALALVLLVGAGLMVKGFARLTENQLKGFDPRQVLTLRTTLPPSGYAEDHQVAAFYRRAEERLSTLPGVGSVSTASFLPGSDSWSDAEFQIEGQPAPPPGQARVMSYQKVGADFFRTVRIPILKGRAFSAGDGESAPRVAVISETMARRYFPGEDPVGRRVKIGGAESAAPWHTIVGVAGDVSRFMFDRELQPMLYLPNRQTPDREAYFVLHTAGEPISLVPAVRAEIAGLDDKLPLYEIKSHERAIEEGLAGVGIVADLLAIFGVLALVLAAVGVYGVMAYTVSQRTHEIGVRMALGAQPRDVLRLVVGQALKLAAFGLLLGLPGAVALGWVMAGALFGIVALDPMIIAGFTLLLTGAALLAGYLPARRAMKVDPMLALRCD